MKTLTNHKFTVKDETGKPATTASLASVCLNQVPQGGFTPEEMRARINILNKLKNAKDKIDLEDSEAKTLIGLILSMKWGALNEEVIKFVDEAKKDLN